MTQPVQVCTLYENLDKEGVDVFSCDLRSSKALAAPDGSLAIDTRRVAGEDEEREILIHEEGHFATGSFYSRCTPYAERGHQEAVACRYGYRKYFPLPMLLELMENGATEPWQLAEALGVSEQYVRDMLDYYQEACGVDFSAEAVRRSL